MTGDSGSVEALRANTKFLKAIFGKDFGQAHVCAVAGDPAKKGGNWFGGWFVRRPDSLGAGTNNYFCVSLFSEERRRISTFRALICLAVDDVGPKLDGDLVELLLGPPTWIVETSPANFQWGYRLDEPITDAVLASELIHRVRVALTGEDGKDPGMENVTRYVRLPSGVNLKGTLSAPFRVRQIKLDGGIGLRSNVLSQLTSNIRNLMVGTLSPGQGTSGSTISTGHQHLRGNISPDDALLKALRKLGLVLERPRETAMGWGYDIRCPWIDEHTDRAETGTVYVAGAGKFKCQHGHCAERTVEDLRGKLDEMLKDEGHEGGLIHEEFDEVDVTNVPPPPQGLAQKPGTSETGFFNHFLVMGGRNMFYDLVLGHEATAAEIDARWTELLKDVLPKNAKGKPISPSEWLRRKGLTINGFISWPGKERIVVPDPLQPTRRYINTWEPPQRPLSQAAATEVNDQAITPWLRVFWHVVGTDTLAQWEIGEILLDWMALALGDQSLKPGWHVIVMGPQGLGKDTMILPVMATLGPEWAQTLDCNQIGQNFNEWEAKRLIQFTETNQNTHGSLTAHDLMTLLKALFDNTRPWIAINPKYRDKYKARNVVMGWFTSNESEPLRLQPDDRRFLVLDRSEIKPLPNHIYSQLHYWLNDGGGIMRVAEFLYRRWDTMSDARKKLLLGIAPMTADKQALVKRLTHPVQDWIERCIEMGPSNPLTFPDIVTANYVHSRLFSAVKTGGEGLPGGVRVPSLQNIVLYLKGAGAVVLNGGKKVKVGGSPVVLYVVRDPAIYELLTQTQVAKVFAYGIGGTNTGTIN